MICVLGNYYQLYMNDALKKDKINFSQYIIVISNHTLITAPVYAYLIINTNYS